MKQIATESNVKITKGVVVLAAVLSCIGFDLDAEQQQALILGSGVVYGIGTFVGAWLKKIRGH